MILLGCLLLAAAVAVVWSAVSMHASVEQVLPLLRTQVKATPAAREHLSNLLGLLDVKLERNLRALERIEVALGIAADDRAEGR